ncbi:MAG: zinc ribbon domain-containing protein [Armatimonadota bacterium]|nr:zinc ribbon domain-containing protein [Armatimonadota bacterium]
MPIYEYRCGSCENRFELLTTISRADQAVCPKCGSDKVRRLVSSFASRVSGEDGSYSSGSGSCCGCSASSCSSCRR